MDGEATVQFSPATTARTVAQWERALLDVYRSSGLFAEGEADGSSLHAEVVLWDTSLLTSTDESVRMVSATLVPTSSTRTLTAIPTFHAADGHEIVTINEEGVVKIWVQPFLLVLKPFYEPDRQVDSLRDDLTRATILQAQATGVFE